MDRIPLENYPLRGPPTGGNRSLFPSHQSSVVAVFQTPSLNSFQSPPRFEVHRQISSLVEEFSYPREVSPPKNGGRSCKVSHGSNVFFCKHEVGKTKTHSRNMFVKNNGGNQMVVMEKNAWKDQQSPESMSMDHNDNSQPGSSKGCCLILKDGV